MAYAKITGTGSYVPEKVLTNDDLSRMLGEDIDEFVSQVIGIRERHVCAEDESTADLATEAARRALDAAGVAPEEIDLIVLATDTPEYLSPATSVVVQQRLGAKRAGTFDVNCACAGFVTALDVASKYVVADPATYRNVLVIGAYAMSKFVDWTEKKTATIFADGAGAVVLRADEGRPGFLASKLVAEGSYHDHMGIYAGGTRMPVTEGVLKEGRFTKVRFVQKYPPEVNIEGGPQSSGTCWRKRGWRRKTWRFSSSHRSISAPSCGVMKRLELPWSARTPSCGSGAIQARRASRWSWTTPSVRASSSRARWS